MHNTQTIIGLLGAASATVNLAIAIYKGNEFAALGWFATVLFALGGALRCAG